MVYKFPFIGTNYRLSIAKEWQVNNNILTSFEEGDLDQGHLQKLSLFEFGETKQIGLASRHHGRNLAIMDPKQLGEPAKLSILEQSIRVVENLNKAGWAHTDLNFSNICVDVDDAVTIIDFGSAQKIECDLSDPSHLQDESKCVDPKKDLDRVLRAAVYLL